MANHYPPIKAYFRANHVTSTALSWSVKGSVLKVTCPDKAGYRGDGVGVIIIGLWAGGVFCSDWLLSLALFHAAWDNKLNDTQTSRVYHSGTTSNKSARQEQYPRVVCVCGGGGGGGGGGELLTLAHSSGVCTNCITTPSSFWEWTSSWFPMSKFIAPCFQRSPRKSLSNQHLLNAISLFHFIWSY